MVRLGKLKKEENQTKDGSAENAFSEINFVEFKLKICFF